MAVILSLPDEAAAAGVTFENNTLTVPAGVFVAPVPYSATGDTPFNVHVGEGAQLTLVEMLASDKSANLGMMLRLAAKSSVKLISVATQSNINIQRTAVLEGEASSYTEQDIFYGTGQQGFGIATSVVNDAPKTRAHVLMHGVLDHSSKASCTGTMRINKGAKGADSRLAQHVLLLSRDAKAENFPYLEIEESDVTAGHAATVRPLDEEQLFYLRSRGLGEQEARRTLLMAFLTPFISVLDKQTQERIIALIKKKWEHAVER